MTKKRKTVKRRQLTPQERFDKAVREGKILAKPVFEGQAPISEEKTHITKQPIADGYMQIGVSQGVTFSESEDRTSNWHRADFWCVVHADPTHLTEVVEVLEDYVVERLADRCAELLEDED